MNSIAASACRGSPKASLFEIRPRSDYARAIGSRLAATICSLREHDEQRTRESTPAPAPRTDFAADGDAGFQQGPQASGGEAARSQTCGLAGIT